jgi:hypothetical protein
MNEHELVENALNVLNKYLYAEKTNELLEVITVLESFIVTVGMKNDKVSDLIQEYFMKKRIIEKQNSF